MHILVTGGAGFIGSHLVRHFLASGHQLTIADRFTYAGKGRRLGDVLPQVQLLIGDLAQGDLPRRCVEAQPDVVLHTAAETHVDRSILDPTTFLHSNAIGTSKLLDAFARSRHRPQFVVYSTDEVYGPSETPRDLRYELDPRHPSNAYSASKVAVEAIVHAYKVTYGLDIVVVRPCNVYGRGQHPEKAIPRWVDLLLKDQRCPVYNDGNGFRDWMHTTDHCNAIDTVLQHWDQAQHRGILNLPCGAFRRDMEVFQDVCALLGKNPERSCIFVPGRPGHDRGYAMKGTRLALLGWRPLVPWAQGLEDMVEFTRAHRDFWEHDLVDVGGDAGGA